MKERRDREETEQTDRRIEKGRKREGEKDESEGERAME